MQMYVYKTCNHRCVDKDLKCRKCDQQKHLIPLLQCTVGLQPSNTYNVLKNPDAYRKLGHIDPRENAHSFSLSKFRFLPLPGSDKIRFAQVRGLLLCIFVALKHNVSRYAEALEPTSLKLGFVLLISLSLVHNSGIPDLHLVSVQQTQKWMQD